MFTRNSECNKEFIRFTNLLVNDATFLLDESLDALRRIRDTQLLLDQPEKWAVVSDVC